MPLSKVLPCLLLLVLSGEEGGVAQTPPTIGPRVEDVFVDDASILVTPVRPRPKERAELETYGACLLTGTNEPAPDQYAAIAATYPYSYTSVGSVTIRLAHSLSEHGSVCVIERIYAEDDKEGSYVVRSYVSSLKMANTPRVNAQRTNTLSPPPAPYVDDVYVGDGSIIVMPVQPGDEQRAEIETYRDCALNVRGGAANDQHLAIAGTQKIGSDSIGPFVLQLADRLEEGNSVCVIEYFYAKGDSHGEKVLQSLVSEPKTAKSRRGLDKARFPSAQSVRTYARVTTGIDVSAAASADPAAHFMADLSFDVPFSNHNSSLYKPLSANGYLRLASIAQPEAVNGIASPATYIKPLLDSTPNKLVQSWEGDVALAARISPRSNLGEQNAYWTASAIIDGGFITPISAGQTTTNPVVYKATQALYDYYTRTPIEPSGALAAKAITDACKIATSGVLPDCYVSYIPQDRTRFFRNYAAGITVKRYRYQGADNLGTANRGEDKFDFPGTATIKIGQNEYVTKGQARGLVLHGDFFWPIPGILGGKWAGTVYLFGQIDEHLSGNESSQQFILATAASTVQRTDPSVAIITVQQPDRDRYRFGVAVDLRTLLSAIK